MELLHVDPQVVSGKLLLEGDPAGARRLSVPLHSAEKSCERLKPVEFCTCNGLVPSGASFADRFQLDLAAVVGFDDGADGLLRDQGRGLSSSAFSLAIIRSIVALVARRGSRRGDGGIGGRSGCTPGCAGDEPPGGR
jgi:hypothetical protein